MATSNEIEIVDDGSTIVLCVKVQNIQLSEEDVTTLENLAATAVNNELNERFGNANIMIWGEE